MTLRFGAVLAGVLMLAAFTACGSGDGDSPSDEPSVVHVQVRWASGLATDVGTLVDGSDVVFVGTVEERSGQVNKQLAAESRPLPYTQYSVRVDEVLSGELAARDLIAFEQLGGVSESARGPVTLVADGDSPMDVGGTYVFFAAADDAGVYSAPPFARMPVIDGQVVAPEGWGALGAVVQMAGLSQAQAAGEVQRAQ